MEEKLRFAIREVKAVAPSAPVSSPPSWIDQTTFFEARPRRRPRFTHVDGASP